MERDRLRLLERGVAGQRREVARTGRDDNGIRVNDEVDLLGDLGCGLSPVVVDILARGRDGLGRSGECDERATERRDDSAHSDHGRDSLLTGRASLAHAPGSHCDQPLNPAEMSADSRD